MVAEHAGEGRF